MIKVHKIINQTSCLYQVIWPCQNKVFQKSCVKKIISVYSRKCLRQLNQHSPMLNPFICKKSKSALKKDWSGKQWLCNNFRGPERYSRSKCNITEAGGNFVNYYNTTHVLPCTYENSRLSTWWPRKQHLYVHFSWGCCTMECITWDCEYCSPNA